ncbi:MAG: PIG-L deacetylase family protein [Rubrivivax sp.]|nr:PIG-L deacetylase family protein [Rubrivivax sp.]
MHTPSASLAQSLMWLSRRGASPALGSGDLAARAMVFAPHPDDEVLGCGGTVALKAASGAELRVVVMTDGRASHASLMDAERLVRMRREEAVRAAPHLGLVAADYVFLDFEDHCLQAHAEAARRRVAQLLDDFDPVQVFVPHRRDRLGDHVATFEIVHAALRARGRSATVFEYPVWLWHTWPWTSGKPRYGSALGSAWRAWQDAAALALGCRAHMDVHAVLHQKRAALAEYASQVRRLEGDPKWPVLADVSGGAFLALFDTGVEVFRRSRA